MRAAALAVGLLVVAVTGPAWAQLDQLLRGWGQGQAAGLSDARIGAGLKEGLQVEHGDHAHTLVDGTGGESTRCVRRTGLVS